MCVCVCVSVVSVGFCSHLLLNELKRFRHLIGLLLVLQIEALEGVGGVRVKVGVEEGGVGGDAALRLGKDLEEVVGGG